MAVPQDVVPQMMAQPPRVPVEDAPDDRPRVSFTPRPFFLRVLGAARPLGGQARHEDVVLARSVTASPAPWLSKHYATLRGNAKVANAAVYRLFATNGADPNPAVDSPKASSATLPMTWAAPGNGDWHVAVAKFNGYLLGGVLASMRVTVVGGVQQPVPPGAPNANWCVEARAGGVVRILGVYARLADQALGTAADTWRVWYTTTGIDPTPDISPPDYSIGMVFGVGAGLIDLLQKDLPAQANGVDVRVIIRTYRTAQTIDSENTEVKQITADAAGPAAPHSASEWRGQAPEG